MNNDTLKKIILWIKDRGCEWSTLRGIIGIACAIAVIMKPDDYVQIFAAGTAAIGFINTIRSENDKDKETNEEPTA